ncbi:MAG: hypothetical protein GY768_30495 [Planctomycetaceae bacterium]|nr:hypothetical protein [Planctomycetaceae bacterium]
MLIKTIMLGLKEQLGRKDDLNTKLFCFRRKITITTIHSGHRNALGGSIQSGEQLVNQI